MASTCEYGFVDHSTTCTEYGGILQQRSMLPVDCRAGRNTADPRCAAPDESNQGSVATGPAFPCCIFGLTSGYVDTAGHRLVMGGSDTITGMSRHEGGIYTVDLASGARTFLSGTHEDARTGLESRGSGPAFGEFVFDVEAGPAGSLVAMASSGIYRVDATSGDRTLISDGHDCSVMGSPQGFTGLPNMYGTGGIAVKADGTIYAASGTIDDMGVAEISPAGVCRIITNVSSMATHNIGAGALMNHSFTSVGFGSTGTLYGVEDVTGRIFSVEPATGMRTLIASSVSGSTVGTGPAPDNYFIIAGAMAGSLWTSGASFDNGTESIRTYVDVDVATGDRTAHYSYGGPIGNSDNVFWIAPHPSMPGVVIASMNPALGGGAIVLYEPATGNSYTLSH